MTLAIALAILLPDAARVTAEQLNARFDRTDDRGFRFDASHHPHITLSQHFVSRGRLGDVKRRVGNVLSRCRPVELRITGTGPGHTSQVLTVEPSAALRELHERLMTTMAVYEVASGDADAFQQDGPPPRPSDVSWVATFRDRSSYAHYTPHITIGIGPRPLSVDPFQFTAREIALCRLGRFCTCRDQLARWTL